MQKIAIVTLTYNKFEEATKEFLESLYKYTDVDIFDLIVVDNASSDDTVEFVKKYNDIYNNISLICNKENLGYSKGNNIGIKKALESGYEYIALLNNDILFTPNWLEDSIRLFKLNNRLGMISPRIQPKGINKFNYLKKYKNYLQKFTSEFKESIEPLFCCVIIKREVIEKIGLLDENFTPAFWEDNDYCLRAMYAGYLLARSNRTFVYHNHSTTSKSISNEIFNRNKDYFFKKHPIGKWIWAHKKTNLINDIKKYIKESFE